MQRTASQTPFTAAGILLGLGLGGFFDGIVLHQVLQWHHMVSSVDVFDPATITGLRANTFADGLFHAATYIFTILGLVFLWHAMRQGHAGSARQLAGLFLVGWGLFNLVEGIVDHLVLGIHHVNETVPRAQWLAWDLAFLAWGGIMLAAGWWLWQQAGRRNGAAGRT